MTIKFNSIKNEIIMDKHGNVTDLTRRSIEIRW